MRTEKTFLRKRALRRAAAEEADAAGTQGAAADIKVPGRIAANSTRPKRTVRDRIKKNNGVRGQIF